MLIKIVRELSQQMKNPKCGIPVVLNTGMTRNIWIWDTVYFKIFASITTQSKPRHQNMEWKRIGVPSYILRKNIEVVTRNITLEQG